MVDTSFPLSHPGIGEMGRDADELPGGRNPGKRNDVGRHGSPAKSAFSLRLGACRHRQCSTIVLFSYAAALINGIGWNIVNMVIVIWLLQRSRRSGALR